MTEIKSISPFLKNFFFSAFKSNKHFKEAEKAIGKIKSVSIIITEEKTFMRALSERENIETPFTPEEKKQLFKTFKIHEETIKESKRIFVMMDMDNKMIHIRQTKTSGEKKDISL